MKQIIFLFILCFVFLLSQVNAQITVVQEISCNGGSDGHLEADPNFGTAPYTYLWSTGDVTPDITGLISGNYSVTITDSTLATIIYNYILNDPPLINITLASNADVLCYGEATGSIDVDVVGGTGIYTYNWSNGAISQDVSNIVAGTYDLVVTDQNSCVANFSYTINQPASAISLSVVTNHVTCNGGNDGIATANAIGGTGLLNYLWSTGDNTPSINGLVAGSYSVTVTDANLCSSSSDIEIIEPMAPVQATLVSTNVTCNGGSDGIATVDNAGGGTGFLSYLWSTGETTSQITGLIAGLYSVTVTDTNGCQFIDSVNITEPLVPVSVSFIVSDLTCNGSDNGTIVANGIGSGNIDYLWSTGDITPNITNLSSGNYSITVSDENNCTAISNVNVNEPPAISINPTVMSSDCDGHNNGAISLIVNGGTAPYTFLWQEVNFDSTYVSQNLVGIRGGTYALTITDFNNCVYLDTLIVPNTNVVSTNIVPTLYVCNGDQGSVSINAPGAGVGVYYTYEWSSTYINGSFTTNDSIFTSNPEFVAGNYSVTITDPSGCVSYYNGVMNQSASPLVVNHTITHNICYEDTAGSIQLSPSGGDPMPGYHATWTGPGGYSSNSFSVGGLAVGDYDYTVTDDSVCSVSGTIRIEPLLPIQGHITSQDVLCSGGNTGSAEAFFSGGTGSLEYLWSNGATTPFITNVSVGAYTLTVTDSVGCSLIDSVMVGEPNPIVIVLDSIQDLSCYESDDGAIWLTTSGGTDSLEYIWLHDGALFPEVTEDILNIPAGFYQVTVFDSIGCFAIDTFTVNQPVQTFFVDSIHTISCNNGSDGYWQIEPSGSDFPYVAIFSTGDTISTDTVPAPFISGLSAGLYSVIFTNAIGCTWTFDLVFEQPLPITVGTVDIMPVVCYGDSTGSIILDAIHGGTSPYTFVWNNGATTENLTNISAGMYNVTITDNFGCNIYETYEVEQPYEWIKFFPTITSTSCAQSEDGIVVLYTEDIYWSPFNNMFYLYDSLNVLVDSVSPGQEIVSLSPGSYLGILINEYGCTASDSIYVEKGVEDCIIIPNLVTINDDGYNDVFRVEGGCEYDEFIIQIFTDWGEQVFESSDCDFIWDPKENKAAANSVYYYYIFVTENDESYEFKSSINIQK